jgi:hypothetical protein
MACTGYSPNAVKVPKSVKRMAANHIDAHERGAFIRSYVRILQSDALSKKRVKDKKDAK